MAQRDMLPVLCSCLESALRPDFYGFPYRALSEQFKRKRHHVMWACVFEMVRCRAWRRLPCAWCRITVHTTANACALVVCPADLLRVLAATCCDSRRYDCAWRCHHFTGDAGLPTAHVWLMSCVPVPVPRHL